MFGGVRRIASSANHRGRALAITPCALIAAFNESEHIVTIVTQTSSFASPVVVVDDGSVDGTAQSAQRAGAVVIRCERNHGKGTALRLGLETVLGFDNSHVLFLDGDYQHDPKEIPKLIECAERGQGDFVIGERLLKKEAMPKARYYANVIGSAILSRFIGTNVGDSQSGFRLIRADLLRKVTLDSTRYEIETEMLIKLVRAGATVDRVPVQRLHYEGARSKMRPFWDTFRTCMLAVWYRYLSR